MLVLTQHNSIEYFRWDFFIKFFTARSWAMYGRSLDPMRHSLCQPVLSLILTLMKACSIHCSGCPGTHLNQAYTCYQLGHTCNSSS